MAERFSVLFRLPADLYTQGAPVLIAAGQLLKDTLTGNVLGQIKLRNISDKAFSFVTVRLKPLDPAGRAAGEPFTHRFMDLNCAREGTCASREAIPFPDDAARRFEAAVTEVIFADGSLWTASADSVWEPLPAVNTRRRYGDRYAENAYASRFRGAGAYQPETVKDLWYCGCGALNRAEETACHVCKRTLADFSVPEEELAREGRYAGARSLLDHRNEEQLKQAEELFGQLGSYKDAPRLAKAAADKRAELLRQARERAEAKARERAEAKARQQKEAAEAAARAKKRRKTVLIVVLLLAAAALAALYFFVLKDVLAYSIAGKLLEQGKYEEAKAAYTALGDYKESPVQVKECDYQAAGALYEAGKFEQAKEAFEALGMYRDSKAQVVKCTEAIYDSDYQAASALYEAGKYEQAKEAFEALGSYRDSKAQAEKCTKERNYQAAKALYAKGDYAGAYAMFLTLKGYKDVDSLLASDQNLSAVAREPYTQVGNIVTYGHYEQDNNTGNGKEAIEWIVLAYDSASGRSLLLSRYGLDAHRFDAKTYQGWAKSEMRSWLNGTFLNNAFTAKEQAGIVTSRISTPAYSRNSGGADTEDKLWLLSRNEASTYLNSKEAGKATPTKYAVAQGAYQSSSIKLNGTGCCWWWLRSPGYSSSSASDVYSDGSLSNDDVDSARGAVRPAFWLDLASADIC